MVFYVGNKQFVFGDDRIGWFERFAIPDNSVKFIVFVVNQYHASAGVADVFCAILINRDINRLFHLAGERAVYDVKLFIFKVKNGVTRSSDIDDI